MVLTEKWQKLKKQLSNFVENLILYKILTKKNFVESLLLRYIPSKKSLKNLVFEILGQSEVGGHFAHRSLQFISFYQIKNKILKKLNM